MYSKAVGIPNNIEAGSTRLDALHSSVFQLRGSDSTVDQIRSTFVFDHVYCSTPLAEAQGLSMQIPFSVNDKNSPREMYNRTSVHPRAESIVFLESQTLLSYLNEEYIDKLISERGAVPSPFKGEPSSGTSAAFQASILVFRQAKDGRSSSRQRRDGTR